MTGFPNDTWRGLSSRSSAALTYRRWRGAIGAPARPPIIPSCYWVFWFTAIRPGCFRVASWSGRPMIQWRSVSFPATSIPTTTPSRHFGDAFSKRSKGCSCGCWNWRARWACSRWGTVGLDGTKIHANASRHSALSYEHAGKIEVQLKAEVAELLARAEAADQAEAIDGMSIPDELARREQRLVKLA